MGRHSCHTGTFVLDLLEHRRHLAAHTLGINFNDEAIWGNQIGVASQEVQKLGVTAVRLWLGVSDWNARPTPWDPVIPFGENWVDGRLVVNNTAEVLQAAFRLKRQGLSVMLIVNGEEGQQPPTAAQAQAFFRHLRSVTETPGSSTTLADVVDYWEIGNEPDLPQYWAPSGANKTNGLKQYVNQYLIPVADVLHEGSFNELVVSGAVSWSPSDLKVILDELKAKGRLDAIDYAGFHPYGQFDPAAGIDEIGSRTATAKSYASAVGKKLIATEWNVRGYGNNGANDAKWAAAIDTVYRTIIQPNYEVNYYFALVNNWAARGGTTSARPGGLLKHNSPVSVTPTSSIASLQTYYNSTLYAADPFYSTYYNWQFGQISGKVINADAATPLPPSTKVYIDLNNNGSPDANEPVTTTGADGSYTLKYTTRQVSPGNYFLRVVTPAGWLPVQNAANLALSNLKSLTNVTLSLKPQNATPPTVQLGSVSGKVWRDDDADRVWNGNEPAQAGKVVYLDINNNSKRDASEPSATTDSAGAYTLTFDPKQLNVVAAPLRVDQAEMTSPAPLISISAQTRTGVNIGIRATTGGSNGGSNGGGGSTTGSISGVLWNDSNGDGVYDKNESPTGVRVVYIDANRNGKRDSGEKYVNSAADGSYKFTGLVAGTYYVSREFPKGYRLSNGNGLVDYLTITLSGGQNLTNIHLGTTDRPRPSTPTMPPPSTPPSTPNPPAPQTPPPATGAGSILGTFFATRKSDQTAMLEKGWVVYIDANKNGKLDAGEKTATVKSDRTYAFTGLAAGSYRVTVASQSGWKITEPSVAYFDINLTNGKTVTGKNFVLAKA